MKSVARYKGNICAKREDGESVKIFGEKAFPGAGSPSSKPQG